MEKMLDSGAVLTDAEIDLILHDEELSEIYEVSSAVRGACVQPSVVDVEQEWRLFRHKILPKPSRWRWTMRVAAVFLGVLLVSSILKVAIDRLLTPDIPTVAEVVSPGIPPSSVASMDEERSPFVKDVHDSGVESVTKPRRSPVKPSASNDADAEEEIDIDEYLRLEQARIENELSLIQAQLYIEELQALNDVPVSSEEDSEQNNNEIRYVIMQ